MDTEQRGDREQFGYERWLSPLSYRYGSPEMREVWSQDHQWKLAQDVWIAVAQAQQHAGLVTQEQVDDLKAHRGELLPERVFELEKQRGHDVAAGIAAFSERAPIGGEIIHLGMTSEDVLSNVEVLQMHNAFSIIRGRLVTTLGAFAERIEQYKDLPCMGFTHLQAAEPTTVGYRFAKYAQDMLYDLYVLDALVPLIRTKGLKGAVGSSASFTDLLEGTGVSAQQLEQDVMESLGLKAVTISDQTYPRKFTFFATMILGNIGQSLHRFALDMQVLQSSGIGEVSEPRRKGQIGSSAMPWKQNPIHAENIDSLTELLPGEMVSAWIASSSVTLERTLRDSAGKRIWLPESFLIIDEALMRTERIIKGAVIHEEVVHANLERFAPFSATELLLGQLVETGMDRKEAHERLLAIAEKAYEYVRQGERNPMKALVLKDSQLVGRLGIGYIEEAFAKIFTHVGDTSNRCDQILKEIAVSRLNT